ncbi:MAG: efflux RND transporter permease subunit, partial [bacterium]
DGQSEPSEATLLAQPLSTPFGTMPVAAVSSVERTTRASRIDRYNRQRASLLTASYPTRSLERALQMFHEDTEGFAMPAGYAVSVDHGYYRRMQQYRMLWKTLVATTLGIVLIIAIAGESLRPALLCVVTLPPTVACALLPFLLDGSPIPSPVIVGLVMLVGTAVNNGILIGLGAQSGDIRTSIMRRAPALVMTTLTSTVAAIPLVSLEQLLPGSGTTGITGPMAQVLFFGSLASFLVTFVVMPAGRGLTARQDTYRATWGPKLR